MAYLTIANLRTTSDVGLFLWTAGLTIFLMGISWGGTIYPWKSAAVISSIVIGAVVLIVLMVWEWKADLPYPAIPVKFFGNRGFMALVACATVASVSRTSGIFPAHSLLRAVAFVCYG